MKNKKEVKVFFPFNKKEYDKCKNTCEVYSGGGYWFTKKELEDLKEELSENFNNFVEDSDNEYDTNYYHYLGM